MHVKESQLTTLPLEEQEMLATLIYVTEKLTHTIERRLPDLLCEECRLLSTHSPTPWAILHWKLPIQCTVQDQEALSLRAALEDIGQRLHTVVHEIAHREQSKE